MTDRELDALVAEKVMGWELVNYETGEGPKSAKDYADASNNDGWMWQGRYGDTEAYQWRPSTDIADAWDVVRHVTKSGTLWAEIVFSEYADVGIESERCTVKLHTREGHKRHSTSFFETAESMPKAVCLAALRTVGVEVKP